ncbi:MAG: alpha/beta fold hydrolase [Bacillota bacterium]
MEIQDYESRMQFSFLNYSRRTKTADLDSGFFITYTDEGEGDETVVFVHGLSSYIPAWDKNVSELKDSFRCIVIDLPGYGRSSSGVHSGKPEFYAAVIAEFINKLNLSNVILAGHSMGGQITMMTAIKYPELVSKMILIAPAGFEKFSEEEAEWLKRNFTVNTVMQVNDEQIRFNFTRNFFSMPEDAEKMIQDRIKMRSSVNFPDYCQVVVNSFYGMLDQPVYERLKEIRCETLVLFGKNDGLIPHPYLHKQSSPEAAAEAGASAIPDSKLVLLDNCGHFLQYEKPNECNRIIKDYLQS